MANQKLQVSRALSIPTDGNAFIPYPSDYKSGTATSVVASKLVDSTTNFQSLNFTAGDIVYNTTTNTSATVTNVTGNTVSLSNDIFLNIGEGYKIFHQGLNEGCLLHLATATASDIVVCDIITAGNDLVSMRLTVGYHPISVLKIMNVSASSGDPVYITALW